MTFGSGGGNSRCECCFIGGARDDGSMYCGGRVTAGCRKLAMVRKAANLTQQELADRLGVRQESVSNTEGRTELLLSTLRSYLKGGRRRRHQPACPVARWRGM